MASLEHTIQSWWLASTRSHDCAGDEFTMQVAQKSLGDLRLNEWSATVAGRADQALQQMMAKRRGERRGAA